MQEDKKERITISIDKELLVWLDKKVQERVFANRSHGFEFLISRKMAEKKEEDDKKP
jgi:metal-responsive CopG/Arc/MetJ family transcriptional regulator